MSVRIIFDDSAIPFVLGAFNKTVSKEGFVVEKTTPKQKVLTPRGEDIPVDEFAGVRRGSTVFVKSDIVSLIEAAEAME